MQSSTEGDMCSKLWKSLRHKPLSEVQRLYQVEASPVPAKKKGAMKLWQFHLDGHHITLFVNEGNKISIVAANMNSSASV